jgi:hypothetical protein
MSSSARFLWIDWCYPAVRLGSSLNQSANDGEQECDLKSHDPGELTRDFRLHSVRVGPEFIAEAIDFLLQREEVSVGFLVQGIDAGPEFITEAIDLLVQCQDVPVDSANHFANIFQNPGMFSHSPFQKGDTFFQ